MVLKPCVEPLAPQGLLDLPLELIDNIYRHLDDSQHIGNFRLTRHRIGMQSMRKTTREYLYQTDYNDFVLHGPTKVHGAAYDNHKEPKQTSAPWTKKLVVQDIVPVSIEELNIPFEGAIRTAYERHSNWLRVARRSTSKTEILEQAVAASDSSITHFDWILKFSAKIFEHRSKFWKAPESDDYGKNHTHVLVKAALENKSRRGPLSLVIKDVHQQALDHGGEEWPEDNKLHSIEIQYVGLNMSDGNDNMNDLIVMCHPKYAHRFSNLRNMSWSGVHLQHEGSLDLSYLGGGRLVPNWPSLTTLELSNVKLGSKSVQYLKALQIHVRFRNVIWLENSITGFEKGSKLRQAVCLGIQVVHHALLAYERFEPAGDITPENLYKHGDTTAKVFLVSYDFEGAQQLARENAMYCSPILLEDDEAMPFITPEEMARYMLHGGYCPIDGIEDGGAVWAEC